MVTEQKALLKLKLRKLLVLSVTIANLFVITAGAVRNILTSDASVLYKLKHILNPAMYGVMLHSLTLTHRTSDGIPMLVSNLKTLVRRFGGSGHGKRGTRRFVECLKVFSLIIGTSRAIPILWKPEASYYLTSFLQDPASCGMYTRVLIEIMHGYVYVLNVSALSCVVATNLLCCDTIETTLKRIK